MPPNYNAFAIAPTRVRCPLCQLEMFRGSFTRHLADRHRVTVDKHGNIIPRTNVVETVKDEDGLPYPASSYQNQHPPSAELDWALAVHTVIVKQRRVVKRGVPVLITTERMLLK